jgi:hypothetical protein
MVLRSSLSLLSLLAVLPGLALAQPGNSVTVTVDPRSFDTPAPRLDLHPVLHDEVAGLAPGQDLGGTPVPLASRIAAVDLDSYRNSQAYQQTLEHYYPRKKIGNGKQLRGLAGAAIRAAVLIAKEQVKDRLDDAVEQRIESGDLPQGTDLAVDALSKAATIATGVIDMK